MATTVHFNSRNYASAYHSHPHQRFAMSPTNTQQTVHVTNFSGNQAAEPLPNDTSTIPYQTRQDPFKVNAHDHPNQPTLFLPTEDVYSPTNAPRLQREQRLPQQQTSLTNPHLLNANLMHSANPGPLRPARRDTQEIGISSLLPGQPAPQASAQLQYILSQPDGNRSTRNQPHGAPVIGQVLQTGRVQPARVADLSYAPSAAANDTGSFVNQPLPMLAPPYGQSPILQAAPELTQYQGLSLPENRARRHGNGSIKTEVIGIPPHQGTQLPLNQSMHQPEQFPLGVVDNLQHQLNIAPGEGTSFARPAVSRETISWGVVPQCSQSYWS